MNIVLFLISLALPTLAGYVFVYDEDFPSQTEKAILSFTLGTGFLSFYLFFLGLLGIHWSVFSTGVFFVPFVAFGLFKWRKIARNIVVSLPSPLSGLSSLRKILYAGSFLFILWQLFYIIFTLLAAPTTFWDAYTLWNYKAKMIYYARGVVLNAGREGFVGGTYANYPLNLPIIRAWTAFFMGGWDGSVVNLHSVVILLCILGLLFAAVKRVAGKMTAMILAALFAAMPVPVYNVIAGYADIAVSYYFLAAMVTLFYWHKTGRNKFLVFSGIMAAIAMFTKNEGVAIVLPSLLFTFLWILFNARRSWKFVAGSLLSFAVSLAVILLWLLKSGSLSAIVRISEISGGKFVFHTEGIDSLFRHLFLYRNFNIFWAAFIPVFAFRWKKVFSSDARFFTIPAFVSLFLILYIFLCTSNVQWLVSGTSINRTMLLPLPLLLVGTGFLLSGEEAFAKTEDPT